MTKIEEVARAIDAAFGACSDRDDFHYNILPSWYTAAARAAIEAMRAPNKTMTAAAETLADEYGYGRFSEIDAEIAWERMIDAALQEGRP